MLRFALFVIASSASLACAAATKDAQTDATGAAPDAARQTQLVRMVRQDCGSCHGIQLTGGLGPALTRERMADMPLESLTAVIYHGRPGTPMPGWKSMINEAEADWIARHLQAGFPLDKAAPP